MIEISLLNILGVAIIGNMVAHWFQPIQGVKNKLVDWLGGASPISTLLTCSKCCSFWLGFLMFFSLPIAAVTSLLGFLINHLIDRIDFWYE